MRINPKQIITAWITSIKPSADQKQMAEKRKEICSVCPSKKDIFKEKEWSSVCSECGCPISKKIFTTEYNPCPLKKWGEVDDLYFTKKEAKLQKSIT